MRLKFLSQLAIETSRAFDAIQTHKWPSSQMLYLLCQIIYYFDFDLQIINYLYKMNWLSDGQLENILSADNNVLAQVRSSKCIQVYGNNH